MNICYACGNKKRGHKMRYSCDCGGFTVRVSRHTSKLVGKFIELGFEITEARSTIVYDNNDVSTGFLIEIHFSRFYPHEMFYNLPIEYFWLERNFMEQKMCAVVCNMNFFDCGLFTANETMNLLIQYLHNWVHEFEQSKKHVVYSLAGFI